MNHIADVSKKVSDTPRMDASAHDDGAIWQTGCEIERELNAANDFNREIRERNEWLNDKIDAANDRIKRLEEAGHELLYDNDNMENINRWRKSKEAKP